MACPVQIIKTSFKFSPKTKVIINAVNTEQRTAN